jgi:hypothetical protein
MEIAYKTSSDVGRAFRFETWPRAISLEFIDYSRGVRA